MITRAPKTFSSDPLLQLEYSNGGSTPVVLRRIPDMTADVGADGTRFDELLRRWVGKAGVTNTFWLMNVPPGTYVLYLYTGSMVPTQFRVMVNGGTYRYASNVPTGVASWQTGDNYVMFTNLVVPLTKRSLSPEISAGGMIEIEVQGTISGLQLRRL